MKNLSDILEGLQGALTTAQKLAPVAEAFGLPVQVTAIASMAKAAVDVAQNVVERIEDGRIVASNEDAGRARALLSDLQDANDALAAKISAS